MTGGIEVEFFGVRGSTPCEGRQFERYGGHSSCVELRTTAGREPPIIFDLGTGMRPLGDAHGGQAAEFHGSCLLTHLHWDHVQGLPFFTPLHHEGSTLDVYGPAQVEGTLAEVFGGLMRPPYFPIRPDQLAGAVRFTEAWSDRFTIGSARVTTRPIPHVGPTLGFRVEWNGTVVAYLSDHGPACSPTGREDAIVGEVLELCNGADLVIHDAQHTTTEFEQKRHWGHCTVDYAVRVAREAGARKLALFHHCPTHGDAMIDGMTRAAGDLSARIGGPEVIAAVERQVLSLRRDAAPAVSGTQR